MARNSGTDLRIYNSATGKPYGYATSCTFDGTTATTEVIHKDSTGNFSERDPSTQSWSLSTEGFHSYDTTVNGTAVESVSDIRSAWINRTRLFLQWTTAASGSETLEGYAYITSFSETAPVNETATYSITFEGDGAIALGAET